MKKRLVVCCDGTWKSSKDPRISNVEKIARAVTTDADDGAVQLVHYVNGVGTGSGWSDRLIGGAFGRGLDANLIDAYRFLALNHEPGDEIFVFGFSRGAYTARSLAGMIWHIGLVTPLELARHPMENLFETVLRCYRMKPTDRPAHTPGTQVPVKFIGVFDTVGALGVPGITRVKHKFHDVTLGKNVSIARQALAIDERRLTFDPCVWEVKKEDEGKIDVKQVWFEGVHSDIGGGLAIAEPSELSLSWMVREAALAGLQFSYDRFTPIRYPIDLSDRKYATNKSMNAAYGIVNAFKIAFGSLRVRGTTVRHRGQSRRLEVENDKATPLLIAAPALSRWSDDVGSRKARAKNIGEWTTLVDRSTVKLPNRVIEIPPLEAPVTAPSPLTTRQ
ncbi:DUF2235 domain-containing protein [Gordonia lacunae]|uniref:T6SS Phospholipase effector Tle1-like catalytic domain-containing protein n=1 Tax=Gordonia lacunae TaxID=417102 RepID=A0A243QCJ0_9ACTN|nr:DUF2235 domain-containing protein [Gordonia lacunae]OUC79460.1 hypothetical protein CA982_08385 [Gordonia lacunae]